MIEEVKTLWLVIICSIIHSEVLNGEALSVDVVSTISELNNFGETCLSGVSLFFYHLEDAGILNSDDPAHIWCLHYIYLPYINSSLANFVDGWSFHPMSSENGLSLRQLYAGNVAAL